jgi:hypothetical protein
MFSAAEAAASAHLAALQPESALGGEGDDGQSGNRILAFQARASPSPIPGAAIALNMKVNFGVPKCRTGAVGAAPVHKDKSLRNFPKRLFGRSKATP